MADAADLKSAELTLVRVRIPPDPFATRVTKPMFCGHLSALWTNHIKVAHILSTDTLANCATFTGFLYY